MRHSKSLSVELRGVIREVPDFPQKGINFKDITPIFLDPTLNNKVLNQLTKLITEFNPDVIVGIDSRGFIMGNSIALKAKIPFVLARKKGKLPSEVVSSTYALEYGEDTLQMHKDSFLPGAKVIIHDDLLATGGTAKCVASLVKQLGGEVIAYSFLIELAFLNGRKQLSEICDNIISLVTYES